MHAQHDRRWDRAALAAIAIGTVLRFAWGIVLHPPVDHVYSDMAGYVSRAQNLASGATLNHFDAFFPPGTHLLLALPMFVLGTGRNGLWAGAVLWFVLSSATPWLAWRWLRRLTSPQAAAIAAIACALWPLYISQAGWFMSEVPAQMLLLLGLLLVARAGDGHDDRWTLLLTGACVGVGLVVRPQLALNFLLALAPLAWMIRRHVGKMLAFTAGCAVPLAGMVVLNTAAAGRPTLFSENGGVNFFIAQCDVGRVVTESPRSRFQIENPVFTQLRRGRVYYFPGHDMWDQGFFVRQAVECIEDRGTGQVRVLGRHVLDLTVTTTPWPQADDDDIGDVIRISNALYGLLLPSIFVFGAAEWWGRRRRGDRSDATPAWLVAHLLCVVPTVLVFVPGEPRYRAPYDVFGFALAAVLIVDWRRRTRADEGDVDRDPRPDTDEHGVLHRVI